MTFSNNFEIEDKRLIGLLLSGLDLAFPGLFISIMVATFHLDGK
jgi:hypothetical protein